MRNGPLYFILVGFSCLVISAKVAAKSNQEPNFAIRIADSLIEAGNHNKAAGLLEGVIKHPESAVNLIQAKILQARILHEKGDRPEAIRSLQAILAAAVLSKAENIKVKLDAYLVLADCYYGMFRMNDFKDISDQVLQLSKDNQVDLFYKARAYTNFARYYSYLIETGKANNYLDSALALYFRAPSSKKRYYKPLLLFTTIYSVYPDKYGFAIKSLKKIDSATSLIKVDFKSEIFTQITLCKAIAGISLEKTNEGTPQKNRYWYIKGLKAYEHAETLIKRYYPTNQIDLTRVYNLAGLLNFQDGYFKLAERYFDQSKNILNKGSYPKDQFIYFYTNTYLWASAVNDSLYSGKLLFEKKRKELKFWQELRPYWQQWVDANQSKKNHYYNDIYNKTPNESIVRICYDLYKNSKDSQFLELAFQAQEDGKDYLLKENFKNANHLADPKLPDLKTIQSRLSSNQAIISFFDINSIYREYLATVITRDTMEMIKVDFDKYSIIRDSLCKDINHFKRYEFEAYQSQFMPLVKIFGPKVNDLLVFPSTKSSLERFDIMVSDTTSISSFGKLPYLFKKYKFSYEYSYQFAEIKRELNPAHDGSINTLQAYIPDYRRSQSYTLPFFEDLSFPLQSSYHFDVLGHGDATFSNYQKNAGNAEIIQIAAHGYADLLSPESIKIEMDQDKKSHNSGYLTIDKIANTKLNANLVVLSVCESGIGDSRESDSYLNMAYWFTFAGARSCLYSNWKIDDRSTAYIIKRFYHYLALGYKKSNALNSAQMDYLAQAKSEEEKNPLYWAGLSIIGDDSPIAIKEGYFLNYLYVLTFLLILVVIYVYRKKKTAGDFLP